MNRNLWTQNLTKLGCPPWPCPNCLTGAFILREKSFEYNETAASKAAHSHDEWDPDWIQYNFTCWVKCGNADCENEAVVAGTGGVAPIFDPEDGGPSGWDDTFIPKFCTQMPDIINFPDKCPPEVTEHLRASFALFWSNRGGAAGRLRIALERLLDSLGVPEKNTDGSGITLHSRIETFATGNSTAGGQLMALKWLGNTGSHIGKVQREELLDAYELLEHALDELIGRRTQKVAELTRRLLEKHAPKPRVSIAAAPVAPPPSPTP